MSVVHLVDEALKVELLKGPLRGAHAQVSFETPDSDWSVRSSGPRVNAFLYSIEEDNSRAASGNISVVDQGGSVIGFESPPRYFRLSYMVSVWTQSTADEHRMLGQLLEWFVCTETLTVQTASGDTLRLQLKLRKSPDDGRESPVSRVWSSLRTPIRPVLDLTVMISLTKPGQEANAAPRGMLLRPRQLPHAHSAKQQPTTLREDEEPASAPASSTGAHKRRFRVEELQ
ncbi:DUF4255 domain-containing protein [Streptomyces kronopolitis]|uniref:DUF4255 domain-containing protein n=1 Tax=Streptomyces kronopolitis TaxID=1612435 RepID=UPI0036CD0B17